jgi:uncharacterized protein (TIRG00374 family)
MRKAFYTIIITLAVYYIFTHRVELRSVLDVFKQADWRWMLAALGAHLLWLVVIAAAFQSTYRLVGIRESLTRLVPLTTAANLINVIAPSYGAGAMAVLIADGRQRKKPAAKVSTAAILYLVYDYLGFMIVLPIGLVILYRNGVLNTVIIAASIFAATIGVTLIIMAILGIQSNKKLGKAIIWLIKTLNRILRPVLRRELIEDAEAESFTRDVSDGLQHIRHSPGNLLVPAILALARKAAMMLILWMSSMAFRHPFNFQTLFAGFTTSYLFTIASITPSGVGFVEGAMTVYISEMNVPLATAAVISLAYRGFTLWLTLLYGLIAIRWVGYKPRKLKADAHETQTTEERKNPSIRSSQIMTSPIQTSNPAGTLKTIDDGAEGASSS